MEIGGNAGHWPLLASRQHRAAINAAAVVGGE